MGFWHTGYMEFHESTSEWLGTYTPPPPKFPCQICGEVFGTPEDLAVHKFDGHVATRPRLVLRGRECGRSRLAVISPTQPADWTFRNARAISINGDTTTAAAARHVLSSAHRGVFSVVLAGDGTQEEFEFAFAIANDRDLLGVDKELRHLVRGRSLTINAIEGFIDRTNPYETARRYRDGLVNYFYGVLAREHSPESGLLENGSTERSYTARFDDAVGQLSGFERPAAEAVCGLVAFHYNQFDIALRKTRSPRVARASLRLQCILRGAAIDVGDLGPVDRNSLDYVLSDSKTEQVLAWCCVPLDGSAWQRVHEMEAALSDEQPSDALKLRLIAAEHYAAAGEKGNGLRHVAALRHSRLAEQWADTYASPQAPFDGSVRDAR